MCNYYLSETSKMFVSLFLFSLCLLREHACQIPPLPRVTLPTNCPFVTLLEICPNKGITYWLYNSFTSKPYQLKQNDIQNLKKAPFLPHTPIKILIHGFTSSRDNEINLMRPEYLKRRYNVITVDYSKGALFPCYIEAVHNTRIVANCTALLIQALIRYSNVKLDMIHVVGFSLGGQIAGRIGTYLNEVNATLQRITGLDPASPLYYFSKSFLSDKSAKFVDVIHTSMYGKFLPAGHIEFYMNNFPFQPGCITHVCNHQRAFYFFGASINSPIGFYGRPIGHICTTDKLVLMGEHISIKDYQIKYYHITTRAVPPYAMGKVCRF